MKKIWIECQKCGSVFLIFLMREKFTPKALSITKYVVHANNLINKEMYESLLSFKNEIGLYFTIKYTFYFIIGALSFYILNKFKILILFLIKMFKRNALQKYAEYI